MLGDLLVREADVPDASAINDLFFEAYGDGYVHPQFYDEREVTRIILDDDSLVLVVVDRPSGRVVAAAGVIFEMGAYSDLVGEFGRLVVHPEWRRKGIGSRLMAERVARVGDRLHLGFAEVRLLDPGSPTISLRHGFAPVGFLPQKMVFGGKREHAALLVRYFGDALSLRRNHPRIIPEAEYLAGVALEGARVPSDAILDADSPAYPAGTDFELEELTARGYPALLRIERGRVKRREVFGPNRLHYGLFKLASSSSTYLVAREGLRIVGALGYMRDEVEQHVRVFEVIHARDEVIPFLLRALERRGREDGTDNIEVDVSAYAPRMQRTLLEHGYLPSAYVPAMAFHDVERLDVLKMSRVLGPLRDLPIEAPEPARTVCHRVLESFRTQARQPLLARALAELDCFRDLSEEQADRLLQGFEIRSFGFGARLFTQGDPADEMIVVVSGRVRVETDGRRLGEVGPGEAVGEVAFLTGTEHSAAAIADSELEAGVLRGPSLEALVRRRTDIGTVVYRNLARGLAGKLRRADGLTEKP